MQIESQAPSLKAGLIPTSRPEANIRTSVKCISKWVIVLSKLKDEAGLIKKLSIVSSTGKEGENKRLNALNAKLDSIISFQIDELSAILRGMLYDLKFLKETRTASRERLKLAKSQMKHISKDYQLVKEKMLKEIIEHYPLQFI